MKMFSINEDSPDIESFEEESSEPTNTHEFHVGNLRRNKRIEESRKTIALDREEYKKTNQVTLRKVVGELCRQANPFRKSNGEAESTKD